MGDLTDGGRRGRSDAEWDALVNRFRNTFGDRGKQMGADPFDAELNSATHHPSYFCCRLHSDILPFRDHDIGLPAILHTYRTSYRRNSQRVNAIERFNRDFGMKIDGGGFVVKDRDSYLKSSLNGRILVSRIQIRVPRTSWSSSTHKTWSAWIEKVAGPFDTYLNSDHPGKLDGKLGDNAHTAYNENV